MIPKIIHFCWFSEDPYPKQIKTCLNSWGEHLKEYQIIKWDANNFPIENEFAKLAFQHKKWAFVADYFRFWVLYHYGGIYLDADMFVVKSFDQLLKEKCFLGFKDEFEIDCAIIGSIKHHPFIKICLDHYSDLQFIPDQPTPLPKEITIITKKYSKNHSDLTLFPKEYFYPLPFHSKTNLFLSYATTETFTIHLWYGGWLDEWQHIKYGSTKKAIWIIIQKILNKPNQGLHYYNRLYMLFVQGMKRRFKAILSFFLGKKFVYRIVLVKEHALRTLLFLGLKYQQFRPYLIESKLFKKKSKERILPKGHNLKPFLPNSKIIFSNEIRFNVSDYQNYNEWRVLFNVFHEGTRKLFDCIQPNDVILDVGANIGYYSLNFAKKASTGSVFSFEPDKKNFQKLIQNIELNEFPNIYVYQIALGSKNKEVNIERVDPKNSGANRIAVHSRLNTSKVNMMTLDNWSEPFNFKGIDWIKIDVEGWELEVIKGAKKILSSHKPKLFIELSDINLKNYGSSPKKLLELLFSLGYVIIFDTNNGKRYYPNSYLEGCFTDIIALTEK